MTQLLATFVLIAFGFAVATAAPQAVGSDLLTEAEQAMFVKGQTLHSQGLYSEAVVILSQFVELYPNSTIKDLGLLWLGRSYLAQGDIANAEKIALRLKAIGDTAMFGIYEEELRIGRQNYARSVSSSHAQTDLTVMTPASPAQILTPEVEKSKPAVASAEVAANQPAVQAPKAVDSTPTARPTITKTPAPTTAATIAVKASTNSGMFLPSALEIPTDQRGTNSKAANASPVSRPLMDKTVVSSPSALTKAPVNAASTPVAPLKQLVIEKTPASSLSAQKPAPTNNVIVVPQKIPVEVLKTTPTSDLPLLRLKIEPMPVRFANDSTLSYRLIITNEGSGVAKDLTVRSELDAALEYVASNLLPHRQELIAQKQILTFRLPLVQPGETKVLEIAVRSRGAAAVNISAQTKHSIFYRDSKGNFLHTP